MSFWRFCLTNCVRLCTAILGWSQIIQGHEIDQKMLSHGLSVIERNAAAQTRLIEDLLEVSTIITWDA
jgi:hypothetical protein